MAFVVPKYLSTTLVADGQQKMPASGKSHMHSVSPAASVGARNRAPQEEQGKDQMCPCWLHSTHTRCQCFCKAPQVLFPSYLSLAWACQVCCTHAMDVCTFISGMPEVPRQCISIKSDWAAGTLTGTSKYWMKRLTEADVGCPQCLICNVSLLHCSHPSPQSCGSCALCSGSTDMSCAPFVSRAVAHF